MDVETITPIRRDTDAEKVALRTYDDLLHLLHTLRRGDWDRLTECAPWTVADMVGHLIGAAKGCGSQRESMRQQAWGFRHRSEHDGNSLDAVNALQVRDHVDLTPGERVSELQRVCAPAVRGRMRFPRPLRRFEVPVASSGSTAGMPSRLQLGKLMDVVYTRDVWLHRIDIARATGAELPLSEVDARVVEDVVRDWADSHRQPFELHLTGIAGGTFSHGRGGDRNTMDAVEFCRAASGRVGAPPLGAMVIF